MRLKPGLLDRFERRSPLLRVAIHHGRAKDDLPHLQSHDTSPAFCEPDGHIPGECIPSIIIFMPHVNENQR